MLSQKETYAIKHIIEYCNQLDEIKQKANNSFDEFNNDKILQLSAGMCIIQIGELSTHLTDQTKTELSSIPWKSIKDMRNIFAHRYGTVDSQETWDTIENKIPDLFTACSSAIKNNILYAEVNQKQLDSLKKENIHFTFKKKKERIIIRFYKFNEEKIRSIINQNPPTIKR
ncbi:MAG: DUF86 domain-containing protein [Ruminococcus sp.]|nr:DUF86 domain-containing protein [Ruminococcus sp.]